MFIVKTKKQIMVIFLIVLLCVFCIAAISLNAAKSVFSTNKNTKTIIIDAGHGLPDGGAIGINGTVEQEINLKIAKKTEEVLKGKGFNVIMTRTDENSIAQIENNSIRKIKSEDMKKRKEIMKNGNADIFLSIHMNSFPNPEVKGLRFFYSENHPEILSLAENMQARISEITGEKIYAVKTADKDLFLMKNPPVPSVLAECGFLSNKDEERILNTEEYQAKIAWAIAEAIEDYYNAD